MINFFEKQFSIENLRSNYKYLIISLLLGLILTSAILISKDKKFLLNEKLWNFGEISYSTKDLTKIDSINNDILSINENLNMTINFAFIEDFNMNIFSDNRVTKSSNDLFNVRILEQFSVQGYIQSLIVNNDFSNLFFNNFKKENKIIDDGFYVSKNVETRFIGNEENSYYNLILNFSSNDDDLLKKYFTDFMKAINKGTKEKILQVYFEIYNQRSDIMMMNLNKLNNRISFLRKNVIKNIENLGESKARNFNTVFSILEDRLIKIEGDIKSLNKEEREIKKDLNLSLRINYNKEFPNVFRDYLSEIIIVVIYLFFVFLNITIFSLMRKS